MLGKIMKKQTANGIVKFWQASLTEKQEKQESSIFRNLECLYFPWQKMIWEDTKHRKIYVTVLWGGKKETNI